MCEAVTTANIGRDNSCSKYTVRTHNERTRMCTVERGGSGCQRPIVTGQLALDVHFEPTSGRPCFDETAESGSPMNPVQVFQVLQLLQLLR